MEAMISCWFVACFAAGVIAGLLLMAIIEFAWSRPSQPRFWPGVVVEASSQPGHPVWVLEFRRAGYRIEFQQIHGTGNPNNEH